MPDENKTERQKVIKSFKYKYNEFLILYGILNVYFYFSINNIVNSIYKSFSEFYTSNVMLDGFDISIISNLFATPILLFIAFINIVIVIIEIFIIILIFNFIYFKSTVEFEEIASLNHNIKFTLLCFLLINIILLLFSGSIQRGLVFMYMYMFLPLFTFFLTCTKIKKSEKHL